MEADQGKLLRQAREDVASGHQEQQLHHHQHQLQDGLHHQAGQSSQERINVCYINIIFILRLYPQYSLLNVLFQVTLYVSLLWQIKVYQYLAWTYIEAFFTQKRKFENVSFYLIKISLDTFYYQIDLQVGNKFI